MRVGLYRPPAWMGGRQCIESELNRTKSQLSLIIILALRPYKCSYDEVTWSLTSWVTRVVLILRHRRAGWHLRPRGIFSCKEEGESCRGVPKCCGDLVCYWENGYSVRTVRQAMSNNSALGSLIISDVSFSAIFIAINSRVSGFGNFIWHVSVKRPLRVRRPPLLFVGLGYKRLPIKATCDSSPHKFTVKISRRPTYFTAESE